MLIRVYTACEKLSIFLHMGISMLRSPLQMTIRPPDVVGPNSLVEAVGIMMVLNPSLRNFYTRFN